MALVGGQNGWSVNGQRAKSMSEVMKKGSLGVRQQETMYAEPGG